MGCECPEIIIFAVAAVARRIHAAVYAGALRVLQVPLARWEWWDALVPWGLSAPRVVWGKLGLLAQQEREVLLVWWALLALPVRPDAPEVTAPSGLPVLQGNKDLLARQVSPEPPDLPVPPALLVQLDVLAMAPLAPLAR